MLTLVIPYLQGSEGDDTVSTIDDHMYHLMCGCCSLCQVGGHFSCFANFTHDKTWYLVGLKRKHGILAKRRTNFLEA